MAGVLAFFLAKLSWKGDPGIGGGNIWMAIGLVCAGVVSTLLAQLSSLLARLRGQGSAETPTGGVLEAFLGGVLTAVLAGLQLWLVACGVACGWLVVLFTFSPLRLHFPKQDPRYGAYIALVLGLLATATIGALAGLFCRVLGNLSNAYKRKRRHSGV